MRYGVLILAVLGALACGALGYQWTSDASNPEFRLVLDLARVAASVDPAKKPELDAETATLDRLVRAAYLLMLACPLGLVGGVAAFSRKGKIAAALLWIAGIAPLIFALQAMLTTSFLLLGALLALFVKTQACRGRLSATDSPRAKRSPNGHVRPRAAADRRGRQSGVARAAAGRDGRAVRA